MSMQQRMLRSLDRDITEMRRDLAVAETAIIADLQELKSQRYHKRAHKAMARIDALFSQVAGNKQEMDKVAQDMREEPYRKVQATTERYQAQQQLQLKNARNQLAARGGW